MIQKLNNEKFKGHFLFIKIKQYNFFKIVKNKGNIDFEFSDIAQFDFKWVRA